MKKLITTITCFMLFTITLFGCSSQETPFEKKEYTTKETIQKIKIDVIDRLIDIKQSTDDKIFITYSENDKESYDFSINNNILSIMSKNQKELTDYIGSKAPVANCTITLNIPKEMIIDLDIKTSNEDILLPTSYIANRISLSTNSGDIQFDKLNVNETIDLETKNGNITGSLIGDNNDFNITTQIKKGKSSLPEKQTGGNKQLSTTNNNGDTNIIFIEE